MQQYHELVDSNRMFFFIVIMNILNGIALANIWHILTK